MEKYTVDYLFSLKRPHLVQNAALNWNCMKWKIPDLCTIFEDRLLSFQVAKQCKHGIEFENERPLLNATVQHFLKWLNCEKIDNPLIEFNPSDYFAYCSYQYMSKLFAHSQKILNDVDWSIFGFENYSGKDATFWLGSQGAYTPLHYDTYGFNIVVQIFGRKKWTLFPPSDTSYLYPTRIPYEESSVFSPVNPNKPDFVKYPLFSKTSPMVFELNSGSVLFVPRHWWHFVENLELSLTINCWIEIPEDKSERELEAVVNVLNAAFVNSDAEAYCTWSNDDSQPQSVSESLQVLNQTYGTDSISTEDLFNVISSRPVLELISSLLRKRLS